MRIIKQVDERTLKERITFAFGRLTMSFIIIGFIIAFLTYDSIQLVNIVDEKSNSYAPFVVSTVNLTKSAAKERGFSSIFLGSNGTEATTLLLQQRNLTNLYFGQLIISALKYSNFSQMIQEEESQLDQFRIQIDSLNVTGIQNLDYYSNMIAILLDRIMSINSQYGDVTRLGSAWFNYAQVQEQTGVRRGTLGLIASQKYFTPDLRTRVISHQANEDAYRTTLIQVFPPAAQAVDYYNSIDSVQMALNITGKVMDYIESSENYTLVTNPLSLFNNMSVLINEFTFLELIMNQQLNLTISVHLETLAILSTGYFLAMLIETIGAIWFIYIIFPVFVTYGSLNGWSCCPEFSKSTTNTKPYNRGNHTSTK